MESQIIRATKYIISKSGILYGRKIEIKFEHELAIGFG
jgi:hypothetical protein